MCKVSVTIGHWILLLTKKDYTLPAAFTLFQRSVGLFTQINFIHSSQHQNNTVLWETNQTFQRHTRLFTASRIAASQLWILQLPCLTKWDFRFGKETEGKAKKHGTRGEEKPIRIHSIRTMVRTANRCSLAFIIDRIFSCSTAHIVKEHQRRINPLYHWTARK